jgi:hypothetical protein
MQDLNLRLLESKTWRANQQDGLFDVFFAVLFLGIALSQIADGIWNSEAASLGVLVGVELCGVVGLRWTRRRITQPRLGVVRFAPERKRRVRTTRIVLAVCVAATMALVVLTVLGGRTGNLFAGPVSRITVSAVAAALILIPLALIAFFQEFPRILAHGVLFAMAEFGGTWLEATTLRFPRAVTFGAAAVCSATIGAVLLVRFLRTTRVRVTNDEPGGPNHA